MSPEASPHNLMYRVLSGPLTPELSDELDAWLREDPRHPQEFAQFLLLENMLGTVRQEDSAESILALLLEMERNAKPVELVHLPSPTLAERQKARTGLASPAWLGMAASFIVLGSLLAWLIVAVSGSATSPGMDPGGLADTPVQPTQPQSQKLVATLTASHDALWQVPSGGRVPGVGDKLRSGDRLTLTAGVADITTSRGAVAVLEAPCTIELTDNDNALYLHAGKLVGLCHTDSSKGFVVKTDHADITDLGTEFGVAVEAKRVIATVFTGKIALAAVGGQPQPLIANQVASLQINGNRQSFVIEDGLAQDFGALRGMLTQTVALPGTGQHIAVGETDPNWQIVAIDGQPLAEPVLANVADPASFESTVRKNLRYRANEPAASQWVTPLPAFNPLANVTYQTMFEISGTDPKSVSLVLRFIADLRVSEIELNGKAISVPQQGTGPAFTKLIPLAIKDCFVTGRNTLTVRVDRQPRLGTSMYWMGFRAELELTGRRSVAGANP